MSSANSSALFACSRCYSRHPFEELSAGQQLCRGCREEYPVVKCTYCRSEFQQSNKGSTAAICKKCEQNVRLHGKPSTCEYCNILAAFIGQKCQRCVNSEKKYGPPVNCEQCKQKCAFDRKDEDKKVDGKLLCWLCTLSLKRALAKSKSTDPARHSHVKLGSSNKPKEPKKPHDKRPQRVDVTKMNEEAPPPPKMPRLGGGKSEEVSNSDHVVAMTQLRETISNLHRQIAQKDKDILAKDRQITEIKAHSFTTENELRTKLKQAQREYDQKTESLQSKVKNLQREVAALRKARNQNQSSLTIVRGSQGQGESSPAQSGLLATINKLKNEPSSSTDDSS